MYYYTSLLSPLTGEQVFGWRMLLTVPILAALIVALNAWGQVWALAARLRVERKLWLVLPVSSALIGVQLWLFLWAPLHEQALAVSLGYFMLPISLLLVGRIVYRERLSRWQNLAALSACVGVAHELYQAGGFPWTASLVAFGYPLYFILRRKMATNNLAGLWFDMLLTLPIAVAFVFVGSDLQGAFDQSPQLFWLIPGLGLMSALAVAFYILASHHLKMGLFGLLGYVEPVLLVFVALLLGERLAADDWMTYVPIWLAVGILAAEGVASLRKQTSRAAI